MPRFIGWACADAAPVAPLRQRRWRRPAQVARKSSRLKMRDDLLAFGRDFWTEIGGNHRGYLVDDT
jgi:hypothetical protein